MNKINNIKPKFLIIVICFCIFFSILLTDLSGKPNTTTDYSVRNIGYGAGFIAFIMLFEIGLYKLQCQTILKDKVANFLKRLAKVIVMIALATIIFWYAYMIFNLIKMQK